MRRLAAWLAVSLTCGLFAVLPDAARAQGLGLQSQDNSKPMNIEADNGIEWQQDSHLYIARGNVKATRGGTTIYADTLTAYYRPTSPGAQPKVAGGFEGGSTEIYRVDADGHVKIATETQAAYGDHGVYDTDQQLVVLTGKDLRLVTPRDTVTAHDSLEWYDLKQLAVARGNAIAIQDQKRLRGDVLTAQVAKGANQVSRISRVDAHGNVLVSTTDQIARADTGVYNVDTGIATLSGRVTLTRAENELRGQYAVVDMNNNTSRLLSSPPGGHNPSSRVEGVIVPRPKSPAPAK